jgi:chromosome segregation ATPase
MKLISRIGLRVVTEVTNQDVKELILTKFSELDKKIDLRISELDRKIDLRASELDKKIDLGLAHVATEIARLDGKIDTVQGNLEGKIGALDAKVDSINRRIGNEELVSRSAFIAVIGGLVAGLVKFLFFPVSPA